MDDPTEALVIGKLRRAGDLIRDAARQIAPETGPENGVETVCALLVRAFLPKIAAQEFVRLGGSDIEIFKAALITALRYDDTPVDNGGWGTNLGTEISSVFGWGWLMDTMDPRGKITPVVFNRPQAEEMHRRLTAALSEPPHD